VQFAVAIAVGRLDAEFAVRRSQFEVSNRILG
jgi:hypothetical protein